MSEYGNTPTEPVWWHRFHEGTFDNSHNDSWSVPNNTLIAVITTLIVSSISGASGSGYEILHTPANIRIDSGAVGAGAGTDCFKTGLNIPISIVDGGLLAVALGTGSWHWFIAGYYQPDYFSTIS